MTIGQETILDDVGRGRGMTDSIPREKSVWVAARPEKANAALPETFWKGPGYPAPWC